MNQQIKIENHKGELIDVLLEGNETASDIVIFVHGFGTDKGEGEHLFVELADYLSSEFLIIRFDQSGYGSSQGLQQDATPAKAAQDLDHILRYTRQKYSDKTINIYAHSMGTLATAILSPDSINKTIFTGATSPNLLDIIERLTKRIESKGGSVDKDEVSIYKRTSGTVQEIGSEFWQVLQSTNFIKLLKEFANKTHLTVIKSKQDQIVGDSPEFNAYENIDKLEYIELQGDHNYANKQDRQNLFMQVKNILESK